MASGDLWTAEDGVACLRRTGVSGVMFARGAMADPRIFGKYLDRMHNRDQTLSPTGLTAIDVAKRHIELTRMYGRGQSDLLKMRTIIPRYLRGFHRVKDIRRRVVDCTDFEALIQCLDQVEAAL